LQTQLQNAQNEAGMDNETTLRWYQDDIKMISRWH
jgi:hypothetical protein